MQPKMLLVLVIVVMSVCNVADGRGRRIRLKWGLSNPGPGHLDRRNTDDGQLKVHADLHQNAEKSAYGDNDEGF